MGSVEEGSAVWSVYDSNINQHSCAKLKECITLHIFKQHKRKSSHKHSHI